ncbi:MAG: DNA mismatch repair endonuclease MutL [Tissierellia bacterium]|jgi:DNA mismatch repair protein MutL|nr:DNA mismatch repair endonuclease MutL [Tissierellia bacterium]MDD4046455.1 DNA mismatch repair endonuclease MutL [Tissierellia bacterium]
MALIHLLDNETINKIAAGEVIESPKSIVKELVENSIDAGADEITVEIKNGGKSLIRISDNGKGIEKDQVESAFKRHCTSKISSSDDLNSLFTLGFRGEALASIAAVSKVEVITRTNEDIYGIKMTIDGGEITSKEDIGSPVGTTITVTDLFYNVPARKKFLKSDASESSSINEIVVSLALSKEYISFKYINNNNVAFRTPKTNNFINTISSLYEKDLYNSLIKIDYKSDVVSITGYTTNLNYYRGNRKQQIVFVNGRVIKHKRMSYFIEAAYYTLLPKNKYPACFLKIEIAPALVDVNVHPAKTEVRFQNEEMVLNEIKRAIYSALYSISIMKEVKKETLLHEPAKDINSSSIFDRSSDTTNSLDGLENKFSEEIENIKITEVGLPNKGINEKNIFEEAIFKEKDIHLMESPKSYDKFEFEQETFIKAEKDESKLPELSIIGIVMDTYIICENLEKTCMFMIDQHAAHERINYERFLNQYNAREILIQEIVPQVIDLSYDDYETAISNVEIFKYLGISIENFGNNAILINSIPTIFKDSILKDVFYSILDSLKEVTKSNLDFVLEKIIKEACVKSVKSGDKLHTSEVRALLNDLRMTDNPYTCPHGRPVIIKMTRYEIEKMFERIQG